MKLILLLPILALNAMACEPQQDAVHPEAEQEVLAALDLQKDAWNAGNLEEFMRWYITGEELRFTTSSGMLEGSQMLLERYREAYPDNERMGTLNFEIVEFRLLDNQHAVVIGRWMLVRHNDRPEGYFTLVWRKTSEGWRIIVDHTS